MASVIVYVTNVNDERPVFGIGSDHLLTKISEEQTAGSVVTIIQATDHDGDNIKYYFTRKSGLLVLLHKTNASNRVFLYALNRLIPL